MDGLHSGRALYRFDADEAPSTYITNYVVTVICVVGVIAHYAKPPAGGSSPVTLLLIIHLALYAIVYLLGGLGHQVWKHNRCPGIEMPANTTIACPPGGLDNEPVISTYLFFLGPCELQLLPMAVALSGLAGKCTFTLKSPFVLVANVVGLAFGILGCALGHGGFIILGALMLLLYLLLAIACAVGCCTVGMGAGRGLVAAGALLVVIGCAIQFLLGGACGSAAYLADGAASCPFGGDGVSGINHNFVYHVFEILSKLCLVAALRFLGAEKKESSMELGQGIDA